MPLQEFGFLALEVDAEHAMAFLALAVWAEHAGHGEATAVEGVEIVAGPTAYGTDGFAVVAQAVAIPDVEVAGAGPDMARAVAPPESARFLCALAGGCNETPDGALNQIRHGFLAVFV